jgi:tRNA/tmRNA/rRNA uracil-C5-methylase (TrmA/RlmC/RlmD family)
VAAVIELSPTTIAHGGEAVARVEGKAHFVAGAMPGERVLAEVVRDKGSWARAELREVLEPSADRIDPPCAHFADCGGCTWQFAAYPAQLEWKHSIVAGQLQHLGGLTDPVVRPTAAPGPPYGYRNRMDFKAHGGRPALLRRRSRDPVVIEECLLLHPTLADLFDRLGDLGEATTLTLRAGTATGETLAVVDGPIPAGAPEWGCSVARRTPPREVIGPDTIHEVAAGLRFRITGDAFFQTNTAAAEALAALVSEALDVQEDDVLLDAYAGGGLFGLVAGKGAERVIAVESGDLALGDLAHNAAVTGIEVQILEGRAETALGETTEGWDVAVVDPPRKGLGESGVGAVTSSTPRAIAYVSCDPAALGRDTRLLAEHGYRLEWAAPVDMFPQTFHVETVAAFRRT